MWDYNKAAQYLYDNARDLRKIGLQQISPEQKTYLEDLQISSKARQNGIRYTDWSKIATIVLCSGISHDPEHIREIAKRCMGRGETARFEYCSLPTRMETNMYYNTTWLGSQH